jgi:hypothetical protein
MVQLTPQSRLLVATQPVDFRQGIDGLAAGCRQVLPAHPLSGAVFVLRNRSATALKLLLYDGQGYLVLPQATVSGPLPVVATHRGRTGPLVSQRTPRAALAWAPLPGPDGS